MLIEYFRGGNFFETAFFNPVDNADVLSSGPTQIVIVSPVTGVVTTFTGTGFPDVLPEDLMQPLSGTLTGFAMVDDQGQPLATITGISWLMQDMLTAIEQAVGSNDRAQLLGLLSLQDITLDGTDAVEGIFELYFNDITSNMTIIGTEFGDDAGGGNGNDIIEGGTGDDSLTGYTTGPQGEDAIYGGDGNDTIRGGTAANTLLDGGQGDDLIEGGTGWDQLSYRFSAAGVTVDLAIGTAADGFGTTDTLTGIEHVVGSDVNDTLRGDGLANRLEGNGGNDLLVGEDGADTLNGGDGTDTLNGGTGDDFIFGGASEADLRDVVFGGDGNDSADGGAGNDEMNGGFGNDTVTGGLGSDTLVGNGDNDALGGGGGSDLMYGNDGGDFLNGGFGYDRLNGGAGADRFYHLGIADHGSDWVQDYTAAEGDVLVFGQSGATAAQFQVNFANTPNAGSAGVDEAFVIYRPTGQILWALVDGGDEAQINLRLGGQVFDLLI